MWTSEIRRIYKQIAHLNFPWEGSKKKIKIQTVLNIFSKFFSWKSGMFGNFWSTLKRKHSLKIFGCTTWILHTEPCKKLKRFKASWSESGGVCVWTATWAEIITSTAPSPAGTAQSTWPSFTATLEPSPSCSRRPRCCEDPSDPVRGGTTVSRLTWVEKGLAKLIYHNNEVKYHMGGTRQCFRAKFGFSFKKNLSEPFN